MISKERIKAVRSGLRVGRTVQLVWRLAGRLTLLSMAMIVLETGLFFGSLYALKILINLVATDGFEPAIYEGAVMRQVCVAGLLTILYNVSKAISSYVTEVQAARVSEHINDKIHGRAIELELGYYEDPAYFDTLQRAKEAGAERPNAVIVGLLDVIKNGFSLLAVASVIVSIDWKLLPVLALFILPTLFVRIRFSDKLNTLRLNSTSLERKTGYISELMTAATSAKEIKAYRLGEYLKDKYVEMRSRLVSERLKIAFQRTKSEVLTTSLASIGLFACIFYITIMAIRGEVGAGDITIFLVVFPQVFNLMQGVTNGITVIYYNNVFVDSIFDLFELKPTLHEPARPVNLPPEHDEADLEVRNVSFQYPNQDKLVLDRVSLTIPQGKLIGIVGLNGAGKSTLIKLLCRLYDPLAGNIYLSGVDIREFSTNDYRKQVGVIFQDFIKYNFSAAENIFFGDIDRKEHTEEDIMRAANRAGAHDYVSALSQGYRTMMGRLFEDGQDVSIGQWQKLATARAMYHAGRFLIFDEASSALDAQAEYALFSSLKKHIGKRGALVISHRYSTVKHVDYIYVLSQGKVVESGSPSELAERNGEYATIFRNELLDEV